MVQLNDGEAMKLRIRDDSIRLRLGRGEVTRLQAKGLIEATTHFPKPVGSTLSYALHATPRDNRPQCVFDNSRIVISFPRDLVTRGATSDEVAMQAELPFREGKLLKVLIATPNERISTGLVPQPEGKCAAKLTHNCHCRLRA